MLYYVMEYRYFFQIHVSCSAAWGNIDFWTFQYLFMYFKGYLSFKKIIWGEYIFGIWYIDSKHLTK